MSIALPVGVTQIILPDVFRLASSAPDACQGVDFEKNLRLTASTP
jgi:hypothetical protein